MSIQGCKRDKGHDLHHGSLSTYTRGFPDLPLFLMVTAISLDPRGRSGNLEVDGSDPPFLPPGSASWGQGDVHCRALAWRGSLPSHQSLAGRPSGRLSGTSLPLKP